MSDARDRFPSRNERRLAALAEASGEVAYQMSPDWSVMRQLQGGGFLADTRGPSRAWMMDYIPECEQPRVTEAIEQAIRNRATFTLEHRVRREDGSIGWTLSRAVPILDEQGRIEEWFGAATDISAQREAQHHRDMLLAELQHRVRNTLAMVRSIVRRSVDGNTDTREYVRHLDGRLTALARMQVMLTRSVGAGADFQSVIHDELLAQAADERQFALAGPPVLLAPKAAEVLTLAIHELATNATKYGALSRTDSMLTIDWACDDRGGQRWLTLCWQERRVAIDPSAPRQPGFGTELIERRVPYELKGRGSMDFQPGGLICRIEFPLIAGESILQTAGPHA